MVRRIILKWLVVVAMSVGWCAAAEPSSPAQIEQSRQFGATFRPAEVQASGGGQAPIQPALVDLNDESFGAQQILKRKERVAPFNAFADLSAFYTNNVALSRRSTLSDAFLVANFGLSSQRKLAENLEFEFTLKGGVFRYSKFTELDLNSLDMGGGLNYRLPRLWDISVFARYNFTDLFNGRTGDDFFQNQTITFGAQRAFVLGRAHSILTGVSGQLGFSDPQPAQRNEWGLYAGYHLDLTRHLGADLFYRYAYQVYTENDRRDHNQAVTLAVRYAIRDWLSVITSSYFSVNDSDQPVYNYEAFNVGFGLSVNVKF